ncbi:exopolysaccharide biosynthesis protein [Bacillus sp. HMF5848]|uniref:PssE/Cps14G family polysaccharide biosynthesis glycosyltransferase n=1 Tax=Bacillus sp. HMF5848 TaxID=2495421 RepID=UPI000F79455E|nr:PssE/Cps14G family polysaccharide biosynthesis glycosyltransferase [Bacillus sp. HMF5848]RSK28722.1 exopolysaccharide biosynthesis protein [Bacillus sp. HMF5848]
MILVVLGTHELPFNRLLKEIDSQIAKGNITEKVIVQVGHTPYRSNTMEFFQFTTYDDMARLYEEARIIITHGGTGSITMGVKMGKVLIAVPRLIKHGEHNDDHQIEIVRQFTATGHILSWDGEADFAELLKQAGTFCPKPFTSGRKQILSILKNYIENEI